MKKNTSLLLVLLFAKIGLNQCLMYPVNFEQRVRVSQWIVLGQVIDKHCYSDQNGNIYTLNKINVTAWLKNYRNQSTVYVITFGGVTNDKAQITYPAIQMQLGN